MRPLFILTLLISLAWCAPAGAQDFKGAIKYPKNPIVLGGEETEGFALKHAEELIRQAKEYKQAIN